jgi:hypothetical protein
MATYAMTANHKKTLLILVLADAVMVAALAVAVHLPFLSRRPLPDWPPQYDWTLQVGGSYYGLFGGPSYTCIMYASDYVTLDFPLFVLAAFLSLPALVITAAWMSYTKRCHANPAT